MQVKIVDDLFAHSRESMYDLSEHLAIVYIMFKKDATLSEFHVLYHLLAEIPRQTYLLLIIE
jgi:hypothetical protein